ncbi:MAG: AbrB family transcriptional regulator [Rhodospirillaceae bacterium]|nr:AbrB family transcriptional regulator [Rhodospirillaceae bacterium]
MGAECRTTTGAAPAGGRWQGLAAQGTALALGTAGGALLYTFQLPLAWMIGSMLATAIAAIAGMRVRVPRAMRSGMIMVLGIMLGSAFNPAILSALDRWAVTLSALAVYIVVCTAIGSLYLSRLGRCDPVTSYFTATPGGFNEMVLMGTALGGDERTIALSHSLRVMLVVFTVPVWFRYMGDVQMGPRPSMGPAFGELELVEYLMLGACAIGGPIASRLRLPAAWLLGPMVLSAAIHLAGITDSRPPAVLIAIAQVVVGSFIGCRFVGTRLRLAARVLLIAAGLTAILLAITVAFAVALHFATGIPIADLVLAYAPGGLAEMSLVALALHSDAAFVSTHHLVRILLIIMFAAPAYRLMRRTQPPPEP